VLLLGSGATETAAISNDGEREQEQDERPLLLLFPSLLGEREEKVLREGEGGTPKIVFFSSFVAHFSLARLHPPPQNLPSHHSQNKMETTFIMIKPDGVQRGLVGQIIARFEARGYHLRAMKFQNVSKEQAEEHYADLKSKPFFGGLVDYIVR
jgi:hypothetical protein